MIPEHVTLIKKPVRFLYSHNLYEYYDAVDAIVTSVTTVECGSTMHVTSSCARRWGPLAP